MNLKELQDKLITYSNQRSIDLIGIIHDVLKYKESEVEKSFNREMDAISNERKESFRMLQAMIDAPHELRVVHAFDVSVEDLKGRSRKPKKLVMARQVMYLYHKSKGVNNADIGKMYGNRNRTTVRSALTFINGLYDTNDKILMDYIAIDPAIITPEMTELLNS